MGIGLEHVAHHVPVSARDIAECPYTREIGPAQCLEHLGRLSHGITCHCRIEAPLVITVAPGVLECGATEFPDKPVLPAILDHCWKMLPERVVLRSLLQSSHGRQRAWMPRAKQVALPGQHKPARRILG